MNINKPLITLFASVALFSGEVMAGVNNIIELTDDSGVPLGTVTVDMLWTDGGTPGTDGLQFDIQYDNLAFTFASCVLNPPYDNYDIASCGPFGDDVRLGLLDDIFDPGLIPSGNLGTVTFNVIGSPGMYQMDVAGIDTGNDPDQTSTDPALIDIVGVASYTSSPAAPGDPINLGTVVQNDPDPTFNLDIDNDGDVNSTLTGSCSISGPQAGTFSLSPDNTFSILQGSGPDTTTITCDSAQAVMVHNATLTCTHDGDNMPASPVMYALSCTIQSAPMPDYGSTPPPGSTIDFGTPTTLDPPVDMNLAIENTGAPSTTLDGSCSITNNPGGVYSVDTTPFSLGQGVGTIRVVTCDTGTQGNFDGGVLSCTHDGSPTASPATYTLDCEVQGVPAYDSTPPPGGFIDLGATPMGNPPPSGQLLITNVGDPGSTLMGTCSLMNDTVIHLSGSGDYSDAAGGGSASVGLTCDTSQAVGSYGDLLSCTHNDPNFKGPAEYEVGCEITPAESDVEESPPSGTPQTAEIDAGGSHTFSFLFTEVNDTGVDGELSDCTLSSGANFTITSPAMFPQTIPSGGSVQVDVQGTDPGGVESINDTLTCAFSDSQFEEQFVSWPLTITIGGRNATFRVSKDFDDNNPAEVEVTISCNTGLPLQQTTSISEGDPVAFVVTEFDDGEMDCDVFEVVPAGYAPEYVSSGDSQSFAEDDGCHFVAVNGGDENACEIANILLPVEVVVNKQWIDEHPEFQFPTIVEITLICNAEIVGGFQDGLETFGGDWFAQRFIDPAHPGEFLVFPDWGGSTVCTVTEDPETGVDQDTSDCAVIPLAPGQGGECTIVNTRLFAGIPTLSQYGLILLALLMLGVGLIGYRRFA